MLGLGLALTASLGWGIADFLGGIESRRLPVFQVMIVSQGLAFVLIAVIVAASAHAPPDLARLWPAAVGGLAGIAGLTAFYRALAIGTMSIVAPIAATGVCVPVIVGIAGGERPAALQLAGIAAAIAGVVLVSREGDPDSERRRVARASVLLALFAAIGFGSFAVGMRSSARADVLWALLAARTSATAAIAVAFLASRRPRAPSVPSRPVPALRPHLVALAAIGVIDLASNGLYAIATRHGLLSLVAVGASLYPVATVMLARVLLRERVRGIQEVGIAAAVAGIALIAAG